MNTTLDNILEQISNQARVQVRTQIRKQIQTKYWNHVLAQVGTQVWSLGHRHIWNPVDVHSLNNCYQSNDYFRSNT